MKHLSVDIETFSSVDIGASGAYKYSQSEDFEILLFGYCRDFGAVEVIDLTRQALPAEIVAALADPDVIKHAYNAAFEWYCLNQAGYKTPIEQWRCTMFHAMYLGYPSGLEATGTALGLSDAVLKDRTGKSLINYFSKPCKATKANGGRSRNLPEHDPEKWRLYIEYSRQDVVAETAIYKALERWSVPEREQRLWELDCEMNAHGVRVDRGLVSGALAIDAANKDKLSAEARELTGLANPNSNAQLSVWLAEKGVETDNLQKGTIESLLEGELPDDVRRVFEIKLMTGKTSLKKYDAMAACACEDDRMRGLLQVYGANRTGRWAGRLVQVQNLARNYIKTLDLAREWTKVRNAKALELIYGNVSDTLSQLIRTAFIPSDGHKFVVADFSAIEARVIAWLADERWRMETFAAGGDIYCASASQMFGVPVEKHGVNGHLRQKGKVAELALGYQGGTGALEAMGALNMGLSVDELPEIVQKWREASPNIVALWRRVEKAALEAMTEGTAAEVGRGVQIARKTDLITGLDFLVVSLPSGRSLYYASPRIKTNKFNKSAVHYMDVNQTSRKWCETSTYGGRMTENIVQAIARDCLAETLLRLNSRYPDSPVVMHIHDEVVMDAVPGLSVEEICAVMAEPISWAPGLVLNAAGFESQYYMKD